MLSVRVTQGRSASRARVGRLVDGVLGHVAVGRPLAAGVVSSPEASMWIVWSRDSAAVSLPSPLLTSGRMPTNTLRTSARVGGLRRYWPAVSRMNSISSVSGRGSSVGVVDRRVGRADERVAVPGNREHHAAVRRCAAP